MYGAGVVEGGLSQCSMQVFGRGGGWFCRCRMQLCVRELWVDSRGVKAEEWKEDSDNVAKCEVVFLVVCDEGKKVIKWER